ncbi:MAG: hypothetical protein GY695_10300, partial [Aestuariibacter sp.]|nr:hypothetical protein [Aestuariibacter sp.]
MIGWLPAIQAACDPFWQHPEGGEGTGTDPSEWDNPEVFQHTILHGLDKATKALTENQDNIGKLEAEAKIFRGTHPALDDWIEAAMQAAVVTLSDFGICMLAVEAVSQ